MNKSIIKKHFVIQARSANWYYLYGEVILFYISPYTFTSFPELMEWTFDAVGKYIIYTKIFLFDIRRSLVFTTRSHLNRVEHKIMSKTYSCIWKIPILTENVIENVNAKFPSDLNWYLYAEPPMRLMRQDFNYMSIDSPLVFQK